MLALASHPLSISNCISRGTEPNPSPSHPLFISNCISGDTEPKPSPAKELGRVGHAPHLGTTVKLTL